MEKEIIDFLALTPQNIEMAIKIAKTTEKAKRKIQWDFWKHLREEFESQKITLLEESKSISLVSETKVYQYDGKKRKKKFYGLWSPLIEINDTIIYYGIEIDWSIYFGFRAEKDDNIYIAKNPEYEKIRDIIKEIDNDYVTTKSWLGQKYVTPKLNFQEFNTTDVFNLADTEYLKKVVEDIVQKSINDIELLKQKLSEIRI